MDDALRRLAETTARRHALERVSMGLAGKVLRRTVSKVDGGVSGVISTSQKKFGLFLFADGTYRMEVTRFTSVSSGGYGVPSEEKSSDEGQWSVEMMEDRPALVLRQRGTLAQWWHVEDGGDGVEYLNGARWDRYKIRP